MQATRTRWAQFGDRATFIVMLLVSLSFVIFMLLWSKHAPEELTCEHLCDGAKKYCAFTDRSVCLRQCAADDATCRKQCIAEVQDCPTHCASVVRVGCEQQLQALYGCQILRCADSEMDVWRECDATRTAYETCMTR